VKNLERNICTKFVPYSLRDEQKNGRVTTCEHFIQTYLTSPHFFSCSVAGDEYWVFQYDPETELQSVEWQMS
jgi:hypothetical protein